MKPRTTNHEKSAQNRVFRQLADHNEVVIVHDCIHADSHPSNALKHIKLFRHGEKCEIPDGCKYLAVVSEMDDSGEWVPSHTLTARTNVELACVLRQIQAEAGNVVIEGSRRFERLALAMGLQHIKSQWGNV